MMPCDAFTTSSDLKTMESLPTSWQLEMSSRLNIFSQESVQRSDFLVAD